MAAVIDVLVIAACDAAQSEWEMRLAYWLVQHDQGRVGGGAADFDVAELGWTRPGFGDERRFVEGVIAAALRREGWERLDYAPHEAWVTSALARLLELVRAFPVDLIDAGEPNAWRPLELPVLGACERHRVYLHEGGCLLCNDLAGEITP